MAVTCRPSVRLERTPCFSVLSLDSEYSSSSPRFTLIDVADLLLHEQRAKTEQVRDSLIRSLRSDGFCFLVARHNSKPAKLISALQKSMADVLFPIETSASIENSGNLKISENLYISEKGVPMYRLGYELCEDRVREIFRVATGRPDDVKWPDGQTRSLWLKGVGLMRHITDAALDLILSTANNVPQRRKRPLSQGILWSKDREIADTPLRERSGDFSVLYAMHYFNTDQDSKIAVKEHVDPSLLVVEPYLCEETKGLQVWDRIYNCWLDCDGQNAMQLPVKRHAEDSIMLMFAGKALAAATESLEGGKIEPTLHRVVIGDRPRRTVIYEQKYEEFFPPPAMD